MNPDDFIQKMSHLNENEKPVFIGPTGQTYCIAGWDYGADIKIEYTGTIIFYIRQIPGIPNFYACRLITGIINKYSKNMKKGIFLYDKNNDQLFLPK
jgi:hypothetical protein